MPGQFDVVVVGSGAAGLALALSLAKRYRIALISKTELMAGSSLRAQGGIAAVMQQGEDSYADHISDTMNAGAGLCDPNVVEFVVRRGRAAIEFLIAQGVLFTHAADSEQLHLTQEGGHSHRRILHVADRTGVAVVKTLAEQVLGHDNIACFTNYTAVDLLLEQQRCVGVQVLENSNGQLQNFLAPKIVLATGGASGCYRYTSNSNQATGDGIAMAWRAGCRIANMEFNQFHPTCLAHPEAQSFLISEAVRGEGGVLRLPNSERFMPRYDQRAELAPRDVVTRAIVSELRAHELDHVLLDISHMLARDVRRLFPTIYQRCLQYGIDITQQPIPVVPAAHYTCGGVVTDLQAQTDIDGLFAIGEVAYTGLHGANRMASNSLLECLVFAASAAQAIDQQLQALPSLPTPCLALANRRDSTVIDVQVKIESLKGLMWRAAGIVRNNADIRAALAQVETWSAHLPARGQDCVGSPRLITYRNMLDVSRIVLRSALARKESRGLHYTTDYPMMQQTAEPSLLAV